MARFWVAVVMLLSLGTAALAQSQPSDIVVKGVQTFPPTTVPSQFARESGEAKQASADAQFFGRCVKPWKNAALHQVIDSPPTSAIREYALDKIIRENSACYPSFVAEPPQMPPFYGACNFRGHKVIVMNQPPHTNTFSHVYYDYGICQAFFDRGALIEKALSTYAPDLNFATEQLFDPAVLARLHAREDLFNAQRAKQERVFAEVATCVVAVHPAYALDLLKTRTASIEETRLRSALLATPECTGGATKVQVDPAQFRVFLADAVYSWALALKGGDTLIPSQGKAEGSGL